MKMSLPELIWDASSITEARRIGYTVNLLLDKSLRYTHFGMMVLPYLYKNTIFLPQIPSYLFQKLAKFQDKNVSRFFKKAEKVLTDLEVYCAEIKSEDYIAKELQFNKLFPDFITNLNLIAPELLRGVKTIVIHPTRYGSSASEISSYLDEASRMEIFWRIDSNIGSIAGMIIAERFFALARFQQLDWRSKMHLRDFLMQDTYLGELFPDYAENNITNSTNFKFPANVVRDANTYLQSLGFKANQIAWHDSQGIFFHGKQIKPTKMEKALLILLIDNIGKMMSYDLISQNLWGQTKANKFSLNAIAKTIQRIRVKLRSAGIDDKIIEVYSGEGYRILEAKVE